MNESLDGKRLTPARETAKALGGISEKTLWNHTQPRGPIPCYRIGSRVMYNIAEAIEAIKKGEGERFELASVHPFEGGATHTRVFLTMLNHDDDVIEVCATATWPSGCQCTGPRLSRSTARPAR